MSAAADRLASALADRYRIERELGEGGMATVYLAEDLKHHRQVAIKVLKPELAAVLGADRFVQEIATTASLQHPNILPLFDSGTADGFLYYVMPYVEGESLRDRLNREKQLPVAEAVDLTSEVADALDYAHRQGVVHRDIKPENILLHEGRPMVADFGIALAVSAAAGGRMTETGLSLGTPHYMSPEQATAEPDITGRSDIYSLAATLYEMLTGDPPHVGSSAQQIIMKIVTEEPAPVTKLRKSVPTNVAAAVAKSLEKLPADRFESAAAFAAALDDAGFTYTPPTTTGGVLAASPAMPGRGGTSRRGVVALSGLLLVAVAAGAWGWFRATPEAPTTQTRLDIRVAPAIGPDIAISPDGRRIVYRSAQDSNELRIRSLNSLESQPLSGTKGARGPVFSPNGRSIAFDQGSPDEYYTMAPSGGSPIMLGTRGDPVYPEGAWSDDGFLYYERDEGSNPGIVRASVQGGAAERIPAKGYYAEPATIPGVTDRILALSRDSAGYGILDVRTGAYRRIKGLEAATYVVVAGGYLFWNTEDGALVAARFDAQGGRLASPPVTLAQGVANEGFAVSRTGTLVYEAATSAEHRSLVRISASGHPEAVAPELDDALGDVAQVRVSPDGRRFALTVLRDATGRTARIAVYDVAQRSWQQLTFEGTRNVAPRWLSDRRIAFISDQGGARGVWAKPFDRSTKETLLFQPRVGRLRSMDVSPVPGAPMVVTLAGFSHADSDGFYLVDPTPGAKPRPFLTSRFSVAFPAISPDGHWLAYASNESGEFRIYVRAYPGGGPPYVMSPERAEWPVWGPTPNDLYYETHAGLVRARLAFSDGVHVVDRQLVPGMQHLPGMQHSLGLGNPVTVFYDVGRDGRILAASNAVAADSASVAADPGASLPVVVQNVFREIQQRLAGGGGS